HSMPTRRARLPKPDRPRALELLADCGLEGCAEAGRRVLAAVGIKKPAHDWGRLPTREPWAVQFFGPTFGGLESAFRFLEGRLPPPIRKAWKDGYVFRYAERTIHQAIVQKLARTISGLHAIEALLAQGLFQEQGIVQRVLDEIVEDTIFL